MGGRRTSRSGRPVRESGYRPGPRRPLWNVRRIRRSPPALLAGPSAYPALRIVANKDGLYSWRLVDRRGHQLVEGVPPAYHPDDAERAARQFLRAAQRAAPKKTVGRPTVRYTKRRGGWRWRLVDGGAAVARSVALYETRTEAADAFQMTRAAAPTAHEAQPVGWSRETALAEFHALQLEVVSYLNRQERRLAVVATIVAALLALSEGLETPSLAWLGAIFAMVGWRSSMTHGRAMSRIRLYVQHELSPRLGGLRWASATGAYYDEKRSRGAVDRALYLTTRTYPVLGLASVGAAVLSTNTHGVKMPALYWTFAAAFALAAYYTARYEKGASADQRTFLTHGLNRPDLNP